MAASSPRPDSREQGLQTSGLSYDGKFLWSVGDQRSVFPASIFRIDPKTGRVKRPLFSLRLAPDFQGRAPSRLHNANPDLEGVAISKTDPRKFFAVIESDGCYILEGVIDEVRSEARILRILSARFDPEPSSGDINARFEGIAVKGKKIWLAYERDGRGNPFLFCGSLPQSSTELILKSVPLPLQALPRRANKGRINFNGLDIGDDGNLLLVLVLRDQERLLFYRPQTGRISFLDLDFRSPDDLSLMWTSPEGVAVDTAGDRLWIVSDPDSLRGNYRLSRDGKARGLFRKMVPLLFELRLSEAIRAAQTVPSVH